MIERRLISKKLLSMIVMSHSDIISETTPMVNMFTLRRINHPSKNTIEVTRKSNKRIHPIMIP